jgi:hypothetical protein
VSDAPSYTELQQQRAEAERLNREAAEYHAAAEKKLADANYALGQSEHRRREIAEIEKSVAERERRLAQLNETDFIAREKAAEQKLAEAKALLAEFNNTRHEARLAR